MKLITSEFPSFLLRFILWMTEHSWLLCRLMKSLLLYSDVNTLFAFHMISRYYFFRAHSSKKPVIISIHKQWVTNDCWIYSALIFLVLCLPRVMLCSGDRIMPGQVVMETTDTFCSDITGIYASVFVSCLCWKILLC